MWAGVVILCVDGPRGAFREPFFSTQRCGETDFLYISVAQSCPNLPDYRIHLEYLLLVKIPICESHPRTPEPECGCWGEGSLLLTFFIIGPVWEMLFPSDCAASCCVIPSSWGPIGMRQVWPLGK